MRAIRVDFAPPSPWPRRVILAAATAILLAAGWQGWVGWHAAQALTQAREQTAALQHRLDVAVARLRPSSQPASAPAYAGDAIAIARIASFDVGATLRAVEAAQVPGAKLSSLDADAQTRTVRLAVEVADAGTATAYVDALNAGDDRKPWALLRLQAQTGGDLAEVRGVFP